MIHEAMTYQMCEGIFFICCFLKFDFHQTKPSQTQPNQDSIYDNPTRDHWNGKTPKSIQKFISGNCLHPSYKTLLKMYKGETQLKLITFSFHVFWW